MNLSRTLTRRHLTAVSGIVLALVVVLLVAPTPASAQAGGALLRFVHAVPGAPNVDILVDNVVAVRSLAYASASRYMNLKAGEHNVTVVPTGATAPLFQGKVALDASQAMTIITQGTPQALEAVTYEDELGPVKPGNTRITAVHAIKDAPAVDVLRVEGTQVLFPLVQGLAYGQPYGTIDVQAAAINIAVVPAGGNVGGAVVKADKLSLLGGTYNMVVVMGTLEGQVKPSYLLLTSPTQADSSSKSGLIRLVHASADAPALDVYIDNVLVAPGLAFGDATPHLALAAKPMNVAVRTAGSKPDSAPLVGGTLDLAGGEAFTVSVAGGKLQVASDNISALDAKKARINVINTTGDGQTTAKFSAGAQDVATVTAKGGAGAGEVAPGVYNVAIAVEGNSSPNLTSNLSLSGGVLYDLIVAGTGASSRLIVAATGLNEQPGSAPAPAGAAVAVAPTQAPATAQPPTQPAAPTATSVPAQPTVAPVQPTLAPTATQPPAVALQATATTEPIIPAATVVPTQAIGITGIVDTNQGVNLKIREYPDSNARTLALVPSETVLTILGIEGPAYKAGTPTPAKTPTLSATGAARDKIWFFVNWTVEADGGTVTGWVNSLFLRQLTRNGKPVIKIEDVLTFPQIPEDRFGEVKSGAVTPVGPDVIVTIAKVNVDTGVNLQLRRGPGTDKESLARIPGEAELVVISKTEVKPKSGIGEPQNPIWLFVRYETETGSVTGWVNADFVVVTRSGRKLDLKEIPTATEPLPVGGVTGSVSQPKAATAPGIIALVGGLDTNARLHLRRDPNANAESLDLVPPGTQLPVLGRNGDGNWLKVQYNNRDGWVFTIFVTVTKNGRAFKIAELPNLTTEKDTAAQITPGPSLTPTSTARP